MIDEIERLKRLRPAAQPPTSEARRAALERLQRAIASDIGATQAPAVDAGAEPAQSDLSRTRQRSRGRARRQRESVAGDARVRARLPSVGLVVSILAAVGAIVIAGGAVVLLGHAGNHAGSSPGRSGPRGLILDRTGAVLVTNRQSIYVQIDLAALPRSHSARETVYRRLARTLGIPTQARTCRAPNQSVFRLSAIECDVATQQQALGSHAIVTVASDVSPQAARDLAQHEDQFPGVVTRRVYVRHYPLGDLASQLLGTVGPINRTETQEPHYHGAQASAIVGQTGLEYYYDSDLRDGSTLRLSLDANLQRAGQQALQHAIDANPPAVSGAFVALDPTTGEVIAMGSNPTFDANILTRPLSRAAQAKLNSPPSNYPFINRAIQRVGPTGSTLTPITAIAALQSGAWSLNDTFDDTGQFCINSQCRHNAGSAVGGVLNLQNALRVSSNDFFYNLGALANVDPVNHSAGGALQQWARAFGIGQPTGIDLGGEISGDLPTPAWRARLDQAELGCERKRHVPSCGIADGRPWSVGDNENLAVGQGDVLATPLQLAVAYAAIANGGTIVRPHVGLDIEQPNGTRLQEIDPSAARRLNINHAFLQAVRQGMRAAASQPGGTSADVFGGFPEQIYGQTGTAQHAGHQADAWYAGFVPPTATSKPIVVVVTVQQGGLGAHTAAPAARQILSQWFLGRKGPWQVGNSRAQ